MNEEKRAELKSGVAQQQEAVAALRSQIGTFERHIEVCQKYIDQDKEHPFDEVELKSEIDKTREYIGGMKDAMLYEMEKRDELERQLEHAAFVGEEQHMTVYLTPKKKVEPSPGV